MVLKNVWANCVDSNAKIRGDFNLPLNNRYGDTIYHLPLPIRIQAEGQLVANCGRHHGRMKKTLPHDHFTIEKDGIYIGEFEGVADGPLVCRFAVSDEIFWGECLNIMREKEGKLPGFNK